MRTKVLWLVALLAVVGVAAFLMLERTPRQTEPKPPPTAETAAEAPPEVEGPPPPEGFEEQLATEREGALIDDARERALDAAREEERERLENLKREQAAAVPNGQALRALNAESTEQRTQRFESETVDRDWAPRAEADTLERISQSGLNALNVRVECKTTVCRLEVVERANETESSVPIGLALLQLSDLQPSPPRQTAGAPGTRVTVSYLARR